MGIITEGTVTGAGAKSAPFKVPANKRVVVSVISTNGTVRFERSDNGIDYTPVLAGKDVMEISAPGAFTIDEPAGGVLYRVANNAASSTVFRVAQ